MRTYVHCPDGHVRHDQALASAGAIEAFLGPHLASCPGDHWPDVHPQSCDCEWCEQERGRS